MEKMKQASTWLKRNNLCDVKKGNKWNKVYQSVGNMYSDMNKIRNDSNKISIESSLQTHCF